MTNVARFLIGLMFAALLCFLGGCGLFILSGYMGVFLSEASEVSSPKPSDLKNWGLENRRTPSGVHALEAWKLTKGSKGIIVAVIDTGVDPNQSELKGKVLPGYDFVKNQVGAMDEHGHGTHVAGIIGATFNSRVGVGGVSPNVTLLPIRYYVDSNTGAQNLRNTVKAIRYAVDSGARIINYSGGGPEFAEDEYLAIKYAEAKGVLVIAAAGNERANSDCPEHYYYPAAYRTTNILSVAAIDINSRIIRSSNWGITKVDVAAPGENIFSTLPGSRYGFMTGTSQATAFVTGIATLILATNPKLTPAQVADIIRTTCTKDSNLTTKVKCGGRVNALEAVTMAGGQK